MEKRNFFEGWTYITPRNEFRFSAIEGKFFDGSEIKPAFQQLFDSTEYQPSYKSVQSSGIFVQPSKR
jgi:hypothetical protein